jgi:two-component system nitrogen regulation response regulator NtrX
VRELRNTIERLVIMAPGERIELRHLPPSFLHEAEGPAHDSPGDAALAVDGPLAAAREEFEKRYILRRYRESGGNMSRTAEALGVERSNLYRKMKAFGLLPRREDA